VWAQLKRFVIAAAVMVALWGAAVVVLNLTVFSPGGFVLSYLHALERGAFSEAAARAGLEEMPVVTPDEGRLIVSPTISATLVTSEDEVVIQARYTLDDLPLESLFVLERQPRTLGLFDSWAFQAPPVGALSPSVIGSDRVRVNGVELAEAEVQESGGVAVLYPGHYVVDWDSAWLTTEQVVINVEGPDPKTLRLIALPTNTLTSRAEKAVTDYLADCVEQAVLQPASCPFGVSITDRVVSDVVWEITAEPRVVLAMRDDEATWQLNALGGEATLTVSLQSLFDGTISDFVETQTIDVTGIIDRLDTNRPRLTID
jgi:hypothetical protein